MKSARQNRAAFTLVEVLVAIVLLSTIALGLTNTLIATRRVLATCEKQIQAVQLAAEGMEQLRAGHAVSPGGLPRGFERSASSMPWQRDGALTQLEVIVSWDDGEPRTLRLTTLAPR